VRGCWQLPYATLVGGWVGRLPLPDERSCAGALRCSGRLLPRGLFFYTQAANGDENRAGRICAAGDATATRKAAASGVSSLYLLTARLAS